MVMPCLIPQGTPCRCCKVCCQQYCKPWLMTISSPNSEPRYTEWYHFNYCLRENTIQYSMLSVQHRNWKNKFSALSCYGPPPQKKGGGPVHTMQEQRGNRGIALLVFNLGTRLSWVVNFMTWQLYTPGKEPQYLVNSMAQCRPGSITYKISVPWRWVLDAVWQITVPEHQIVIMAK
jgi:hypothetical protein